MAHFRPILAEVKLNMQHLKKSKIYLKYFGKILRKVSHFLVFLKRLMADFAFFTAFDLATLTLFEWRQSKKGRQFFSG